MNALSILRDDQKGQERLKVPKEKQIPVSKDTKLNEIQSILRYYCKDSPKLRQLLPILAEIIVLRKEKSLLWVRLGGYIEELA